MKETYHSTEERPHDVLHWCDPSWHGGHYRVADFTITRVGSKPPARMIACCDKHLGRAVRLMKARNGAGRLINFRIRYIRPKQLPPIDIDVT